jgi:hypothetical protein
MGYFSVMINGSNIFFNYQLTEIQMIFKNN